MTNNDSPQVTPDTATPANRIQAMKALFESGAYEEWLAEQATLTDDEVIERLKARSAAAKANGPT